MNSINVLTKMMLIMMFSYPLFQITVRYFPFLLVALDHTYVSVFTLHVFYYSFLQEKYNCIDKYNPEFIVFYALFKK